MSFEMFVQAFRDSDAVDLPADAFRVVWEPYVDEHEPEFQFRHVTTDDGAAELYGDADLMITGFSGEQVMDLIVEHLTAAGAVLLVPGVATMLVRDDQRPHLPAELRDAAVTVVGSGADIMRVLRETP